MSQMVLWMLGIAFGAAAMMFTAAIDAHLVAFALAAVIVTCIVLAAVRDFYAETNQSALRRSAILMRHLGLLWGWAAMSLSLIYGSLLHWNASRSVFLVVVLGAGLCLFIANILARDAALDTADARLANLADKIVKAHFGAACVAVGGLVVFGKLSADAFGGDAKWAAVNILLCLGLAIAALSGFAIAHVGGPVQPDETQVPDAVATREATTSVVEAAAEALPPMPVISASRLRQAARAT